MHARPALISEPAAGPVQLRPKPWVIGLVVFLVTWSLTTHGKFTASGDEPHYLMIARSLVADRDLDLGNNYEQNDGLLFGHNDLEMGRHARPARGGRVLSTHDIGLAIFVLPAYVVAQQLSRVPSAAMLRRFRMDQGLFAYSIVSVFLMAMTAAAVSLLYVALAPVVGTFNAALTTLAAALSPPVLSHAFLVFPEGPAFALTCVVVWYVLKRPDAGDRTTLLWIAAGLGLLPWVHRKYSFFVFGLLFLVLLERPSVWRGRNLRWVGLAAAAGLFVVPQIALHAWTLYQWGSLGGPQMLEGLPFSATGFGGGLLGLWIDRTSGLLAYAPLYWIVPACCVLTWRTSWPFVAAAALLYLPMAAFVDWSAGFSPAARYLVPTIPLMLVPLACGLRVRAVRLAVFMLIVPQALIDIVVWQYPRTLWPAASGMNAALERLGAVGRAYESMLPPLRDGSIRPLPLAALSVLLLSLIAAAAFAARNASAPIRQRT